MPLQFDNRVSWMDIVAIGGSAATGLFFLFSVSGDVEGNATEIRHLKDDLVRIERDSTAGDRKILDELKENRIELKEYRQEARESDRLVNQKLDRLIERELDGD